MALLTSLIFALAAPFWSGGSQRLSSPLISHIGRKIVDDCVSLTLLAALFCFFVQLQDIYLFVI